MNTPTHLLVSAALLTRPGAPKRNIAVMFGALLPDLSIFVLFVWARLIVQAPEREIWRYLYWQEPWQTLSAVGNSIPLYGIALAIGLWRVWPALAMFGASALCHIAFDFPFHAEDAHRHFWPISDWRFHSPLSYWDSSHHGDIISTVELGLALALMWIIFRRFNSVCVRIALAICLLSYIAVPLYFMLTLGG